MVETAGPEDYSDPLMCPTAKWGDVISPFGGGSQPNLADVNAIVAKFAEAAGAPSTVRADQRGPGVTATPNTADLKVDLADAAAAVSAFTGATYPYSMPTCP